MNVRDYLDLTADCSDESSSPSSDVESNPPQQSDIDFIDDGSIPRFTPVSPITPESTERRRRPNLLRARSRGVSPGPISVPERGDLRVRPTSTNSQGKRWAVTWFGPVFTPTVPGPLPEDSDLYKLCWSIGNISYFVGQLETSERGLRHLQCFFHFSSNIRFNRIKAVLPGAHIAIARGSDQDNERYCSKLESRAPGESGPWTIGEPVNGSQGRRNDLIQAVDALKSGKTIEQVLLEFPIAYARGHRMLNDLYQVLIKQRTPQVSRQMNNYFIFGPSTTGKTHFAHSLYPESTYAVPAFSNVPAMNGYVDEKAILFDDLDNKTAYPVSTMLQLMRPYGPLKMNTKGSFVSLLHTSVIITSNMPPDAIWSFSEEHFIAFQRRVNHWVICRGIDNREVYEEYESFKKAI